jgi:MFS family permease
LTQGGRNLAILAAGQGLNAMAGGFIYPFLSVYVLERVGPSAGAAAVGLLFAGATLVSAVGRIVGGELADRQGRRAVAAQSVALRSVLLGVVGVLAHAHAPIAAIALPFLASNFARGAYEPASDAMIADMIPPAGRPRAYAQMRIARNAGWAIGPALGGFVGAAHFPLIAAAAAGLGFLNLTLLLAYLVETTHIGAVVRFRVADVALVLRDRPFRTHCLLTVGLFVLFAQLLVAVSIDLAARLHLSSAAIGWAYTVNGVIVVLLQGVLTQVVSRWRAGPMLAVGALIDGVGYWLVGFSRGLPLALTGVAIVTLGEMITIPLSASLAADLAPPDRRGRYLGTYGVFVDSGHGFGQVVGGLGLAAVGVHTLYFWWGVLAFSAAVAAGYVRFGHQAGGEGEAGGQAAVLGAQ